MESNIFFRAENISKAFGPTQALKSVDIEIRRGMIHGIFGENGSGKSTFASIVAAVLKADSGNMYFEGGEYRPNNAIVAESAGISMIAQEQNTINMITVASNIFLGIEDRFRRCGLINIKSMHDAAEEILGSIGANYIRPDSMINILTFEDRKLVEIARAIYADPKLLIVDETTTALTLAGREILYKIMEKMRSEGRSVLFISHDVDEIIRLCDRLTILRDGIVTADIYKDDFDANIIKQLTVGREIKDNYYRADHEAKWEERVALKADNICCGILKNITFELHEGEILGLGGLTDCGMHMLGKILFGLIEPDSGNVYVNKNVQVDDAIKAIQNKMGYVSKNRDQEAMMLSGSIKDNICLTSLKRISKYGLISKKSEERLARTWSEKLGIKMNSLKQFCSELSGGNKQKVVLAKWLCGNSNIFILDCPTRGIDIGVKASIYKLMEELKAKGKAILMISEELPELIGMSDRILILKDGKLAGEFMRNEMLSESRLIDYMI